MLFPGIDLPNPFTTKPFHEKAYEELGGMTGLAGAATGGLGGYVLANHLKKKYPALEYMGVYFPAILSAAGMAGGNTAGRILSGIDKNSNYAGLMAEAGQAYLRSKK